MAGPGRGGWGGAMAGRGGSDAGVQGTNDDAQLSKLCAPGAPVQPVCSTPGRDAALLGLCGAWGGSTASCHAVCDPAL